jgi:hypothetical protein
MVMCYNEDGKLYWGRYFIFWGVGRKGTDDKLSKLPINWC